LAHFQIINRCKDIKRQNPEIDHENEPEDEQNELKFVLYIGYQYTDYSGLRTENND
jgi:hypothetical protein